METADWTDLLADSTLFSRLNQSEVERLLADSLHVSFDQGQTILREGDASEHVYIIGSGKVVVALAGAQHHQLPIESMDAGNFFGEMACIEHKPRMASIIADSDCELLQVPASLFQRFVEDNPRFAAKLSLILSDRLRKLTEEILGVRLKDVDEKLELANAKLDASLKAMDSQMKAAETVFEQTSTRANEVIHSFDRTRSQLILAGSVFFAFIIVVGAVFAYMGLDKWTDFQKYLDDTKASTDIKLGELDSTSAKAQQLLSTLEPQVREATEFTAGARELQKAKQAIFTLLIRSDFEKIAPELGPDVYSSILDTANLYEIELVFLNFPAGLATPIEQQRALYFELLEEDLNLLKPEREGHRIEDIKRIALSYYYLIAGHLSLDNERSYVRLRNEFESFMDKVDQTIPFTQDMGPDTWFGPYLEAACYMDESTECDSAKAKNRMASKISRLNHVWDKIIERRS